MTITDNDASQILDRIMTSLRRVSAADVLTGIDETRRIGIEEPLMESSRFALIQVAGTRRRPLRDLEMLHLVLELLRQRIIIIPDVARAIERRLGSDNIQWRVDSEFSSADRFPETKLQNLLPSGVEDIAELMRKIDALIGKHEIGV